MPFILSILDWMKRRKTCAVCVLLAVNHQINPVYSVVSSRSLLPLLCTFWCEIAFLLLQTAASILRLNPFCELNGRKSSSPLNESNHQALYLNGCFVRTIAACKSVTSHPNQILGGGRKQRDDQREYAANENRNHNTRGITDNIYDLFHSGEVIRND